VNVRGPARPFASAIVVVGALYALLNAVTLPEQVIGFLGVLFGAGNVAGGYVVTERILEMSKPSQKKA
jgi:NAD(P) transhydrogenase subunit alpha